MKRPRPVVPPRTYFDDDEKPLLEGKTVFEGDAVASGLVDADGNPIEMPRRPIGFVHHRRN